MSEDAPDPDDEFEDQLSDVGSRTREKFSAEEQKKAEKLGVSPSGSTDPSLDTTDDTTEADGGISADDGASTDDEGTSADTGGSTDDDRNVSTDVDSTGRDDGQADADDTGVEVADTGSTDHDPADRTHPSSSGANTTDSESGTVYEYNDMNSKLEHDSEPSVDDQPAASAVAAETDQPGGAVAGFGGVTTGERMAVTKTEVDFVTGDEGETNETEQTKLLFFELNDELFAAPLESISSVEELSGLTRYPRSPEPIDGVTDMRGKIIAVLNPKVIVDLSNASHENGSGGDYIIVQEEIEDEHRIGVRVDDISHVESASEDSITPIYDISEMDLVTVDESYLEGIIHGYRADEQAQVPLVDFTALMETLKEY